MKLKVLLKASWKCVDAVENNDHSKAYSGREQNYSTIKVSGSPQ
jgi:hypothetical protein